MVMMEGGNVQGDVSGEQ